LTPEGAHIRNPAFDVTPAKYITAIITERGVARAPYHESLAELMNREQVAGGRSQQEAGTRP
jgi:methylthioribose-1-phosphate isomerase